MKKVWETKKLHSRAKTRIIYFVCEAIMWCVVRSRKDVNDYLQQGF